MCSHSRRNPNQRFNPFDFSRPISLNLDELRLLPQRGREEGVRLTSIRLSSYRISKNKEITLSPLSEVWKSVVPCGKMISFSSSPSDPCPVLSYPVFPGIILFSLIIIFCKRKRGNGCVGRKKGKDSFRIENGCTDGLIGGAIGRKRRLSTGRPPSRSSESV